MPPAKPSIARHDSQGRPSCAPLLRHGVSPSWFDSPASLPKRLLQTAARLGQPPPGGSGGNRQPAGDFVMRVTDYLVHDEYAVLVRRQLSKGRAYCRSLLRRCSGYKRIALPDNMRVLAYLTFPAMTDAGIHEDAV